ncbi:MAG: type IV pilin protein [Gammaproteobacteria bacterium]
MKMKKGSASFRRQRGFTLVEVMVAAVVMFLLVAVSIPVYQGYMENARREAIVLKTNNFKMFLENYHIDEGTYVAGDYVPGGVNDFAVMGYRVPNDDDGISFRVEAGSCGDIADCYKVTASNQHGEQGTLENQVWTWE